MSPKCEHHDRLEDKIDSVSEKVDKIWSRLSEGDVQLGKADTRISFLEKLTYGFLGLALTAIAGALIAMVIKNPITP